MILQAENLRQLAFAKTSDGLLPAIVQDAHTFEVLMLGYVNLESLQQTFSTGLITFYSRSRQQLWTKGESSGNHLQLVLAKADCDLDSILFLAIPQGPTCHNGTTSCFDNPDATAQEPAHQHPLSFLLQLEQLLYSRQADPQSESYTSRLLAKGPMKIAQKVGEEGVEVALEAAAGTKELLLEEAADLLFHLSLLLRSKNLRLAQINDILRTRHQKSTQSHSSDSEA